MRKYLTAYAIWLVGVLSAAAVAWYFYRRILVMGDEALAKEFRLTNPPRPAPVPAEEAQVPTSPQAEPEPTFEDAEPIDEARPPSFADFERRRGRAR